MTFTPILVGVAQNEQRLEAFGEHKEPLDLMADALAAAAEDAGNPALLNDATALRVVRGKWPYSNPAGVLAERLGLQGVETGLTPFGGNYVQHVINQSALDVQAGRHAVVLITGAECGNTQAKAKRAGQQLRWEARAGEPDRQFGEELPMAHPEEIACGVVAPVQMYAMFEHALRHHLGESAQQHAERVSTLWAGFSQVAANNPHAWLREPQSATAIRTPGPRNRPVSDIYPKLMNSNNSVDQGAALILTSTEHARKQGIAESRWVYLWAGTDAHDTPFVSNRDNLYSSPAIRHAGNRCLELAGVAAAELDHVDLYSCFPVAVQVAARELGLDQTRPLTVTGGLTFAGGPLNNYVMHSVARTVELSRAQPDTRNLVTANGGYLTKHAFGVYSATPPGSDFRHADLQSEVDAEPRRQLQTDYAGDATVEAYAVMHDAEGPAIGHLACLTDAGERVWANIRDRAAAAAMIDREVCGERVRVAQREAAFL